MSLHEEFQDKAMIEGRKNAGLRNSGPFKASLKKVIIALVNRGKYREATELLFGSREQLPLIDDGMGFLVFRYLQSGVDPEVLKEAAGAHCWNPKKIDKASLVITVYSGERLLIKDSPAFKILMGLRQVVP